MVLVSLLYVGLIAGMFGSMARYATPDQIAKAVHDENILFATKLSLVTCTISAVLSLWVAVPIGYLMSRFSFRGKAVIDTILDIPIILPPLVVGLGLLILFRIPFGEREVEVRGETRTQPVNLDSIFEHRLGDIAAWLLAAVMVVCAALAVRAVARGPSRGRAIAVGALLVPLAVAAAYFAFAPVGEFVQRRFAGRVTHSVAAVVLAQFMVAAAFAVRTMRVTFDQIHPRREQVALTLGASRSQAFWGVALPEARRGMMAATTLAWARSLGEFGPILVFASATRMRTEVLPTTVWLELQTGSLEAAAVVSLIMVVVAVGILVLARVLGLRKSLA